MKRSLFSLFALLLLPILQVRSQGNFNGMMSTYGDTSFGGYNGIVEMLFVDADTSVKSLNGIMTIHEPQPPGLEGRENGLMDTYYYEQKADTQKKSVRIFSPSNDLIPALSATFYFEINSFRLTKASRDTLMKFLPLLRSPAIEKIHLYGYTDNSGPVNFNQKLSQQRADALKNWLIANGVKASLIEAKGMGPQECEGFNAAQWRKVELQIELK